MIIMYGGHARIKHTRVKHTFTGQAHTDQAHIHGSSTHSQVKQAHTGYMGRAPHMRAAHQLINNSSCVIPHFSNLKVSVNTQSPINKSRDAHKCDPAALPPPPPGYCAPWDVAPCHHQQCQLAGSDRISM